MLAAASALLAGCSASGAMLGASIEELDARWVEVDLFFDT